MGARIVSVSRCERHQLSKPVVDEVRLTADVGVEGDCHAGETVQHRSRVGPGKARPNLRQVHLIPEELLEELRGRGFRVGPGVVGENITTRGIDLLSLPRGARLALGADAEVELTGLRTPCHQLDDYQAGLLEAMIDRSPGAPPILKAGVMSVVTRSGVAKAGDSITVMLPPGPRRPLGPV
ncbi:MAG TPA: MOSC domain-containing protein [Caulobacteraceae bacterium]|nr:MOSC domain-containing protein [Caulobacteraceae bacterium]